ncbi:MAG: polyprenyl synthetase family protein [Alphaproteobacteria bacterium]|nr:polyprenyl synthetase family protein [Alphaproteobacteria bacterium]
MSLPVRDRFDALRRSWWPPARLLIDELVPRTDSVVGEIVRYHLDTGGKRLRAVLPLLVAEVLGRDPETVLPFGAACEMLHNATLVHDDLQDGDPARRGAPTVWRRFGEGQAINAGDAMLYYAIALIRRLDQPAAIRDELVGRMVADTLAVIEGQALELALHDRADVDADDYFRMVEGKTSGLFSLPLAGAARLCGVDPDVVDGLAEAARHLGVLFQVQDDLLDVLADKGRGSVGNDVREGKRSFLAVHALAVADDRQRARLQAILDLHRDDTSDADVAEAIARMTELGAVEAARDELTRRRASALAVPALAAHPALLELVEGLADLLVEPIAHLLGHHQSPDEAFCIELLPAVSRTFALSIELLPASLREPVRVGYLLCRILDTIEDEPVLDPDVRDGLFDTFDAALCGVPEAIRALETQAIAVDLGEGAEARLAAGAGAVFRRFFALPEASSSGMRPAILEMSRGMRIYARRTHEAGRLSLVDVPDLEQYCYYVAGTVGELLTGLFLRACPVPADTRDRIRALAVPFGLALQIVNIVKDCAEDQERGVSFMPADVCARHGVTVEQLVEPAHRDAALAVVADVVDVARHHLQRAVAYTACWPADARVGSDIRLFCLVPLVLALETLTVVLQGQDTLVPGRTPKVSREVVHRVMTRCTEASRDDAALARLLDGYGFDVPAPDDRAAATKARLAPVRIATGG